jgi:signal transduction histidine kinase
MTDESILHEIVSNLIVNATQYTPAGGSITVTYDCDEMVVRISIKDTGIGIPEEYQSEMFKQFSRADNALLAYPAGTGLGLYVIKLLLDKLDATIECNSKVGVGTTFTVSIPRNGPLGA